MNGCWKEEIIISPPESGENKKIFATTYWFCLFVYFNFIASPSPLCPSQTTGFLRPFDHRLLQLVGFVDKVAIPFPNTSSLCGLTCVGREVKSSDLITNFSNASQGFAARGQQAGCTILGQGPRSCRHHLLRIFPFKIPWSSTKCLQQEIHRLLGTEELDHPAAWVALGGQQGTPSPTHLGFSSTRPANLFCLWDTLLERALVGLYPTWNRFVSFYSVHSCWNVCF